MYFKEQPLSLQNPFLQQAFTRIETAPSQESQIILIAPHLVVGLTGLEPVTPRLSSACSNQLSYKPDHLSLSSLSLNLAYQTHLTVPGGAEETRTPDIVLAKHSLYHLSYSPPKIELCDRITEP